MGVICTIRPCGSVSVGDHADTAKDGVFAESLGEYVDVPHAVEDGIDHGLGADGGPHVDDRLVQRMGLHAEKDEIVGDVDFLRGDSVWLEREVAVRADDLQSVALELLGPGGTDEEGDVAAGLGESHSEVAAYRTGADNEDLHGVSLQIRCGMLVMDRLLIATGAGHEVADGFAGIFVVVEDGVHLLGDGHLDAVAGGETEGGGGAADAFGDFAVEAGDDLGELATAA